VVDQQHGVACACEHLRVEVVDLTEGAVRAAVNVEDGGIGRLAGRGFDQPAFDLDAISAGEEQALNWRQGPAGEQAGVELRELAFGRAVRGGCEQVRRRVEIAGGVEQAVRGGIEEGAGAVPLDDRLPLLRPGERNTVDAHRAAGLDLHPGG